MFRMESQQLLELAQQLVTGNLNSSAFLQALAELQSARWDEATLDLDRRRRCGFPEVIYGAGKSAETVVALCQRLHTQQEAILVTRVNEEQQQMLRQAFPDGILNPRAKTFRWQPANSSPPTARVAVITAGTSDLPVAEEALETLLWMGVAAQLVTDVGVAGPHRLPQRLAELAGVAAVVVVAGMEGALPSVVGGYVPCPVIGVPTSVGYGANFGGVSALLSMLNSCAANVTVVNIDAGFKGGYVAGLIATRGAGG